ncbi:hypothetical protein AK812_SmicGene29240 [Symbiodinium microadriaticum]|uniref:Uncharacterized protein n=1 Tax=Symbiodinium microadriaticum TaxID=2951 RepID=A0A1Q9D296_SYMMI|nr:hypothetical protein AK812_SmicGene29240 [Symbiodinium microadriaticum]
MVLCSQRSFVGRNNPNLVVNLKEMEVGQERPPQRMFWPWNLWWRDGRRWKFHLHDWVVLRNFLFRAVFLAPACLHCHEEDAIIS